MAEETGNKRFSKVRLKKKQLIGDKNIALHYLLATIFVILGGKMSCYGIKKYGNGFQWKS